MNLTLNITGLPETERLFLRALTEADLPFLASILQDPAVMYAWEHTFTDQEVADFLRASLRRYCEISCFDLSKIPRQKSDACIKRRSFLCYVIYFTFSSH